MSQTRQGGYTVRPFLLILLGWAVASHAVAADEPARPLLVLDTGGHTAAVSKALFTPDGKELITVSADKTVRVWDVATGETLRVLWPPSGPGLGGQLFSAALAPDGRLLAVGGVGLQEKESWVYLIDLPTGRIQRTLQGHTQSVTALAFSPDGKWLASGSDDLTIRLWDTAGWQCRVLKGHGRHLSSLAFSPDSRRLASAGGLVARLWNVATGKQEAPLKGHEKNVQVIAWSPDGKTVATASTDTTVRLWNPNGACRQTLNTPLSQIRGMVFTADSKALLLGGSPRLAYFLDLASGKEQLKLAEVNSAVFCAALSPDGRLAVTAGALGDELQLWKTTTGALVQRLSGKGQTLWNCAWSPDGQAIAWGGGRDDPDDPKPNRYGPLEGSFSLTQLEPGPAPDDTWRRAQTTLGTLTLHKPSQDFVNAQRGPETSVTLRVPAVRCYTLLPGDRAVLGSGAWQGKSGLFLYDARSGKELRAFKGTNKVYAVAPSPDNRYLLSTGNDQCLRIWDPNREEPLLSLFVAGSDWIAWTPEGYYAASPGGEQLMGWQIDNGPEQMGTFHPAFQFRASLYRPDVIKLLLKAGSLQAALKEADKARNQASQLTDVSQVLPPRVVLEADPPEPGKPLKVRATAWSVGKHPVTALRLFVNGRPYRGKAGIVRFRPPRLGQVTAEWTVQLGRGPQQLMAQAESRVSKGLSEVVSLVQARGMAREDTGARQEAPRPGLYVLAVGVSAYPGELQLRYAHADARDFADTCARQCKPLFRDVGVHVLPDKQATAAGILKGLAWLKEQAGEQDVAVFLFAGHGFKDDKGTFYLLPVDGDPRRLAETALSAERLKEALEELPCRRVLVLLDACHSGALGKGKLPPAAQTEVMRTLTTDDYGLMVMCSSRGSESSLEDSTVKHGYFTYALLEGLSGKAANAEDGLVYLHRLDAFVIDDVMKRSRLRQNPVSTRPLTLGPFPLAKPAR
jgi:WD40 repeat protein